MDANSIGSLVVGLVLVVLIFLAFRSLMLWYWKLNEIIDLLRAIRNNLREIRGSQLDQNIQLDEVERKAKLYDQRISEK